MRFLHVIGTLNPAYGGPAKVAIELASSIGALGHDTEIVTLDSPEAVRVYVKVPTVTIRAVGPSLGKYGYNADLVSWLVQNAVRFDAVIVHGIWQYQSLATWIASRRTDLRYFVFVHGALDPWFRREYPLKHLKKWLYWPWAEYRVLRDAAGVLFTSPEERQLAAQSFRLYRANEIVVNYGIEAPTGDAAGQRRTFLSEFPELQGKRLILFLGRLHPKKGCDLLIRAFSQIAPEYPELHLVLAGPGEAGYRAGLVRLATRLGIAARTSWLGLVEGALKWGALHSAEVLALPSHSENFGVVVAEALACGLPVLITEKVNVWREIKGDGAGIVETDTVEGTLSSLRQWCNLAADDQLRMRSNARNAFLQRFEIGQAAKSLLESIRMYLPEAEGASKQSTSAYASGHA